MIVHIRPYGRLGNQLFFLSHLLAFSLKYGHPLFAPSFRGYSSQFPWFQDNSLFRFPQPSQPEVMPSLTAKLWAARSRMPWESRYEYWANDILDFDSHEIPELLEPLARGRDLFYHGWLLRGFDSVKRYRDQIRKVFSPPQPLLDAAQTAAVQWKGDADLLVGVHVRWEDYRGGPHFITAGEFQAALKRLEDLLRPKRVAFIVFSNELKNLDGWNLSRTFLARGTPLEDLTAMANCDLLLGPPSTFSGWASFYGEVPILTLSSGQPLQDLSGFRVIHG